jgi:thiamine pyrophosphokinase
MAFFMSRAVIFVNGQIKDIEPVRRLVRPDDTILAADGGTHLALTAGLTPSIIIGDLDSLNQADQMHVKKAGCKIIKHPRDKDETDFELALSFVVESGFSEILIIGALGGRLDQTLGNLSVLTNPGFAGLDTRIDDGTEAAWFLRDRREITGSPGDTISLIPWGGDVTGATTTGLRWPLHNESLFADKTRGISNELMDEKGSISINSGLLLVVQRRNM